MSLTTANAVIMLAIPPLFTTPVQLQQFDVDDIFDGPSIEAAETVMGADGELTGGFVYSKVPQTFVLQADSPSVFVFDQWQLFQQSQQDTITASGVITLVSLGQKWTMTKGFLTRYPPLPAAKRVAKPRHYEITWKRAVPQPT